MAECHSVQVLYYWTIETLNRRWSQWQNVILFKCSTTGLSRHSEQKMITMAECHSVQVLYYWTIETLSTEDDHNGRMSFCSSALLLDYRDTLNRRWSQWQNVILFRYSTTGLLRHSEQKMITMAECHSVQVLYYWTIETLWTEDDHNGRMSFCSSTLLLDYRDTLNRRWSQWQNVILFRCSTTGQSGHSEQKMITMAECHSVQVLYYWTIETLSTEDDHNGRMSFCSGALLLDNRDTLNRRWSQWQNVILFKCSTTGLSRHSEQKMITMAECHSVQVLYYWTIETLNRRWSQWQNVILFKCSTTGLSRHSEQKMITMAECHSVQVLYYWTIETLWTEDDHNGRMSFCSGALLLDYRDTLNRRWSQWQNVILFRCSTTGLFRHSEQKMITMAECHSVQVLYYWTIETLWTEDDHNGRMSFCSGALLLDYLDTLNRRWSQWQNVILFKCSTTGLSRHSEQKMITMAECHSVQVLYYWTIETLWTEDDHNGRMSFCSSALLLDYRDTLNRRWSQWQNVTLFRCSTTGLSRHSEQKMITMAECHSVQVLYYWTIETLWTEDDHNGRMSI